MADPVVNTTQPIETPVQDVSLTVAETKIVPEKSEVSQPEKKPDDGIMTKDERQNIGEDMKKSVRDIGRIPYLLILPLINLIQSQYDKIPESRRQWFARMAKDIKWAGSDGIQKIKDRWSKKDEKKPEEVKPELVNQVTPTTLSETKVENTGIIPEKATITENQPEQTSSLEKVRSEEWFVDQKVIAQPPTQTTTTLETDSGKQLKVTTTTTIVEEKKAIS
jgi:hypothetical protein